MEKYYIPVSVLHKGFEMTQEIIDRQGPMPDWAARQIRFGFWKGEQCAVLKSKDGQRPVPAGWFVVQESTTKISVYDPQAFAQRYKETEVTEA